MVQQHHRDMGHLDDEVMPLVINWATLLEGERNGALRFWVARVGGELAGLLMFQLFVHAFYSTSLRAMVDGAVVIERYRGHGTLYLRMWKTAIAALRELGVKIIIGHDNPVREMPQFFDGLGFEPMMRLYIRAL